MFQQISCSYNKDLTIEENDRIETSEEFVSKKTKDNTPNLPEVTRIMLVSIIKNVNDLNSRERASFLTLMNALLGLSYELR